MKDLARQNRLLCDLYEKHYDFLIKWSYRYVSYNRIYYSHLDDWVQDAFFAAIRNIDKLLEHPNHAGWLVTACKNRIDNELYKERIRRKNSIGSLDGGSRASIHELQSTIDLWFEQDDAKKAIDAVCALMTYKERTVYVDHFENQKTTKQIAEERNKTEHAIKATIRRIREKAKSLRAPNFVFFFIGSWYLFRFWLTR